MPAGSFALGAPGSLERFTMTQEILRSNSLDEAGYAFYVTARWQRYEARAYIKLQLQIFEKYGALSRRYLRCLKLRIHLVIRRE